MSADQDDKRDDSAKKGATTTLLGEAISEHLAGQKALTGKQVELFAEGDQLPDDELAGAVEKRGPGRPPGAQNKATEAFRRFVRAKYGDPLLKMMERCFADPVSVAKALGKPEAALGVWQAQAEWLIRIMPYMHSAMPAEVKIESKGRLAVAIGVMPGLPAGDRLTDGDPLRALLQFAQENQALVSFDDSQLHVEPLHVSRKPDDGSEG